ncbi:hypothetical protein FCM35_KLT05391 [Carex littledalei]|uniref:Uncharacterized protein n=1 Tax=Carex littledalei TaxID=544730 RepID=A0A833VKH3_9POAL|nr:hypothetical protein FCM35_KLT05391 [Carex littledalei]
MMITKKQSFSYSRVDKLDSEEEQHQKAQILIEKILKDIDNLTKRPTPLRRKAAKVSAKVGLRLKRIRVAARKMRLWLRRRIEQYLRPSTIRFR